MTKSRNQGVSLTHQNNISKIMFVLTFDSQNIALRQYCIIKVPITWVFHNALIHQYQNHVCLTLIPKNIALVPISQWKPTREFPLTPNTQYSKICFAELWQKSHRAIASIDKVPITWVFPNAIHPIFQNHVVFNLIPKNIALANIASWQSRNHGEFFQTTNNSNMSKICCF